MRTARLRRLLFSTTTKQLSKDTDIPERTLERYKTNPFTIPLDRLILLAYANHLTDTEKKEVLS